MGFLAGRGIVPQLLLALVLALTLYILLMVLEVLYKTFAYLNGTRIDILPLTCQSERKSRTIVQNPHIPQHTLLPFSDNERSGLEFTYTFFMYVNPSSFRTEEGLLHIFHKG